MRQLWPVGAVVAALLLPPAAHADDVTEQLDQAASAYRKKDLTTALTAIEAAADLLRQMKTEAWKAALPEPLPGWTADKPEGQALSPALFGGAMNVSRSYHKSGNSVTVSITADSPVVQALANFMQSGVGGFIANSQMIVLDGRRVLASKDPASYQTLVANRVLVKVEGHDADDAALRQYLKAVKYDEIEKLAK